MEKIKVFVMPTCPDCTAVKQQAASDPRFELIDIGAHVRNLKQFLALRDTNPAFSAVKQSGAVGIPCFLCPDGRIAFSLADLGLDNLESVVPSATDDAPSCSLDGKGC
ncbi:MAG: hypothetical protein Q4E59_06735 [Bacteroidales bacterium]|nr:hypothetical protein [Bacteroidales bacterium]